MDTLILVISIRGKQRKILQTRILQTWVQNVDNPIAVNDAIENTLRKYLLFTKGIDELEGVQTHHLTTKGMLSGLLSQYGWDWSIDVYYPAKHNDLSQDYLKLEPIREYD